MRRNKTNSLIIILLAGILFYLLSYTLNEWLDSKMVLHQLIQLPSMFVLGILLAFAFPSMRIKDISWGISALIFVTSSLIFWMLPHSIDYAVINDWFNRIMHLNMIICGLLLIAVFREILFEIRIYFLGMLSAMLIATGITLRVFKILLCSSFTIEQQKETGGYLILLGSTIVIYTLITFFRMPLLSKKTEDQ